MLAGYSPHPKLYTQILHNKPIRLAGSYGQIKLPGIRFCLRFLLKLPVAFLICSHNSICNASSIFLINKILDSVIGFIYSLFVLHYYYFDLIVFQLSQSEFNDNNNNNNNYNNSDYNYCFIYIIRLRKKNANNFF